MYNNNCLRIVLNENIRVGELAWLHVLNLPRGVHKYKCVVVSIVSQVKHGRGRPCIDRACRPWINRALMLLEVLQNVFHLHRHLSVLKIFTFIQKRMYQIY